MHKKLIHYFLFLCFLGYGPSLCAYKSKHTKTDRKNILHADDAAFWHKASSIDFNKKQPWKWGVATSDFQLAGSAMGNKKHCLNSWGVTHFPQPGIATGHWEKYKEDVQLIKQCGFNSYRFSIEWSKVNPAPGVFNSSVMAHYVDLCKELIANDIEPIPCLFHHAWPDWFGQKGGFEKGENIEYFIAFAQYVFQHLIHVPEITMWMTFNEPVGYAMEGWIRGHYPPCKKNDFKACGTAVLNMMRAHVKIYHMAHALRSDVMVGFPHIFNYIDSYHWFNPMISAICSQMNYLLHDVALNYFKTGIFRWSYVFGSVIADDGEEARGALDYIGINYYSHTTLKLSLGGIKQQYTSGEKILGTQALYPKGLYKAIKKCAKLNVPMYITENGISDPDDVWKDEYIRHHLAVVLQALQDGYDIRGYFWWTLIDCFEWSRNAHAALELGATNKTVPIFSSMGLYALNCITLERTFKPGAQNFVNFLHAVR